MPVEERTGFEQPTVDIIKEAFVFLKSKILQFGENKKKIVDKSHHSVIDKEIKKEIDRIEWAEDWLEKEGTRFVFRVDRQTFKDLMDIIRSGLEVYLKDTKEAKARLNIAGFDSKIEEIARVIRLDAVKEGSHDLYDEYYKLERREGTRKTFFSYSHNDKILAGKIAAFLRGQGVNVFLAHEDIEISEEWRDEIHRNLRNCDVLLALLTPSFKESVWTNQEAGYMMGREAKVVPLIVGEADIKEFGFLEALQGIQVKEEKPELSFEGILSTVEK